MRVLSFHRERTRVLYTLCARGLKWLEITMNVVVTEVPHLFFPFNFQVTFLYRSTRPATRNTIIHAVKSNNIKQKHTVTAMTVRE